MAEILVLTFYTILYFSFCSLESVYLLYLLKLLYSCMITRQRYTLFNHVPDSCQLRTHFIPSILLCKSCNVFGFFTAKVLLFSSYNYSFIIFPSIFLASCINLDFDLIIFVDNLFTLKKPVSLNLFGG